MVKCPKCGKKIDQLLWQESVALQGVIEAYFDEETGSWGRLLREYKEVPQSETSAYSCPKCKAVLFSKPKQALEFLKGADQKTA